MESMFEHSSTIVRNERVKLAALFWNITGAGLFVGSVAGAFFVRANFWPKFGIGLAGFVLGILCFWFACQLLTYLRDDRPVAELSGTRSSLVP